MVYIFRIERNISYEICATIKHTITTDALACGKIIADIDFIEARAVTEHFGHIRHLVSVEWWQVKRGEAWALTEHASHIRHLSSVEWWQVERCEAIAATEHTTHILHLGSVEWWQVERCEAIAATEHVAHIRHLGSVEWWQVKIFEAIAAIEHVSHIRHFLGVEILYTFYCFKFRKKTEPLITRSWPYIFKWFIKYHFGNRPFDSSRIPTRCVITCIELISVPRYTSLSIECKGFAIYIPLGIAHFSLCISRERE